MRRFIDSRPRLNSAHAVFSNEIHANLGQPEGRVLFGEIRKRAGEVLQNNRQSRTGATGLHCSLLVVKLDGFLGDPRLAQIVQRFPVNPLCGDSPDNE